MPSQGGLSLRRDMQHRVETGGWLAGVMHEIRVCYVQYPLFEGETVSAGNAKKN